jgi:hypothetical protein
MAIKSLSPVRAKVMKDCKMGELVKSLNNPFGDEDGILEKKVTFDESKNEVYHPKTNALLTPEEIENAWWNAVDFQCFLNHYFSKIKETQECRLTSIAGLEYVINACKQPAFGNIQNSSHIDEYLDITVSMVPIALRGMEADVAPILKHMRKRHSKNVLEYTNRIPNHFHLHLKERMLAEKSIKSSRPLKTFARVTAKADAQAAAGRHCKTTRNRYLESGKLHHRNNIA